MSLQPGTRLGSWQADSAHSENGSIRWRNQIASASAVISPRATEKVTSSICTSTGAKAMAVHLDDEVRRRGRPMVFADDPGAKENRATVPFYFHFDGV